MPCLTNPTRFLAAGLLAVAAGVAGAQPAAIAAGPGAPATPGADLAAKAREWLAATYRLPAPAFGVQPLDARVQSRGCPAGWQFDQPFPGNDGMLRARCADPAWQVFVQVTLPPQAQAAQRPAAPAPQAAAAPAAPVGASIAPPRAPAFPPAALPPAAFPAAPAAPVAPGMAPAVPAAPAVVLVRRGQVVLTTWSQVPGLTVSARLESLDDGRLGESIRLKNRDTGRIVTGVVNGQNSAQGL
ncbi:flagella basal body P-ring formation protein FlgA [Ramlibacter sp. MAHUQ-53]|uniref:flagella basal body P-ring formation protein FlgA n=1 Tax=unclassified Ramlibacter TaxID=2617605 RepID=UPI00363A9407